MKDIVFNKKALFNYFILDKIEAGISLEGSEVKSIREGGMSLVDSFIIIRGNEAILKNAHIKNYTKSNNFSPDPRRDRKLLLHRDEIRRLNMKVSQKGYTLIPLRVYFSRSLVKVEVGLAKGKQLYDKKDSLKDKDIKKDMLRQTKLL